MYSINYILIYSIWWYEHDKNNSIASNIIISYINSGNYAVWYCIIYVIMFESRN